MKKKRPCARPPIINIEIAVDESLSEDDVTPTNSYARTPTSAQTPTNIFSPRGMDDGFGPFQMYGKSPSDDQVVYSTDEDLAVAKSLQNVKVPRRRPRSSETGLIVHRPVSDQRRVSLESGMTADVEAFVGFIRDENMDAEEESDGCYQNESGSIDDSMESLAEVCFEGLVDVDVEDDSDQFFLPDSIEGSADEDSDKSIDGSDSIATKEDAKSLIAVADALQEESSSDGSSSETSDSKRDPLKKFKKFCFELENVGTSTDVDTPEAPIPRLPKPLVYSQSQRIFKAPKKDSPSLLRRRMTFSNRTSFLSDEVAPKSDYFVRTASKALLKLARPWSTIIEPTKTSVSIDWSEDDEEDSDSDLVVEDGPVKWRSRAMSLVPVTQELEEEGETVCFILLHES